MTSNPPETNEGQAAEAPEDETAEAPEEQAPTDPLVEYGERVADVVDGASRVAFGTIKVEVPADRWVEALTTARDDLGLIFFSWLSAVDWSNEVAVGDPLDEETTERIELLCTVADVSEGRRVTFSTSLPYDRPSAPTLVEVYAGADWHEREAREMFGIDFVGHPNPAHLYLPDGFLGHPLRKTFPLLSREVKPWPGKVDVEAMPGDEEEEDEEGSPSTENPEA